MNGTLPLVILRLNGKNSDARLSQSDSLSQNAGRLAGVGADRVVQEQL